MADSFFLTTAIDYTNGAPHIGHAYEKVLADVIARYHRLKGSDVFFLTGVDQHGQKVQQSAEKAGVPPQAYVDTITAKFIALWRKLGVEYTGSGQAKPAGWAATTDPLHKECVRANLQMLWDDKVPGTDRSRWLYKKTQRGFYSVRQEQFLTDKERGPDGEFGPEWQPVEEREEENFYFRLTAHEDLPTDPETGQPLDPKAWLLRFIDRRSREGNPFVIPEFRVAELRNAVEKLEGDLCISRPAARLQWGIPFPEPWGAGFVTYVWFDALVNYISFVPGHDPYFAERQAAEPTEFGRWWRRPLHIIGKDILIPAHGVYWPVMLKALGFRDEEQPTLLVHGWWNISGAKMSKSLGNVVDPDALADKYGAEALRYYLMSDIATGKDADFSEERLVQRFNTDLANSLGNLLNRTLNMAAKYREGKLTTALLSDRFTEQANEPDPSTAAPAQTMKLILQGIPSDGGSSEVLAGLRKVALDLPRHYALVMEGDPKERRSLGSVNEAIDYAGILVSICNQTVDLTAPWKLAKDPTQAEHLDAVLYHLAESLRIIAILLSPVLPRAAHGIFDQLNWKMDESGKESRFRLADATWGGLPDGHQLGQPTPLFPRIEAAPAGDAS
jgi:methionyl-tRNA synthetase